VAFHLRDPERRQEPSAASLPRQVDARCETGCVVRHASPADHVTSGHLPRQLAAHSVAQLQQWRDESRQRRLGRARQRRTATGTFMRRATGTFPGGTGTFAFGTGVSYGTGTDEWTDGDDDSERQSILLADTVAQLDTEASGVDLLTGVPAAGGMRQTAPDGAAIPATTTHVSGSAQ